MNSSIFTLMNTAEKRTHLTEEEYFAYEASIEGVAEYFNGEIFDMAGGSESHSSITSNLNRHLGNKLEGKDCRVYGESLRLQIEAANSFVRPDLWVICGKTDLMPKRKDTARNPVLIIEVQSKSTTNWDRTGKFNLYRKIPTLMEYVLVEQSVPQVDLFARNANGFWEFRSVTEMEDEVFFQSLGVAVPMADIYRNVDFEAEE
ncbi:MAG: hypothetical protein RLZZ519_1548 [Bacteroidota bacterium]